MTGGGGTELVTVKDSKKDEGSNTWLWVLAGTAAAAGVGLLVYNARKKEEVAYEANPTRQAAIRQVPYNVVDRFDRRDFNPHTNIVVQYKGKPVELLYRGGRNRAVYSQGQFFYVLSIDRVARAELPVPSLRVPRRVQHGRRAGRRPRDARTRRQGDASLG